MSLLYLEPLEVEMKLAQKVFNRHFERDNKLASEYDERRRKLMLTDIQYNLKIVNIAVKYGSEALLTDYAGWIYKLLVSRMNDLPPDRIKDQMITHYRIMAEVLNEEMSREDNKETAYYLDLAIQATEEAAAEESASTLPTQTELAGLRSQYLQHLLEGKKQEAIALINKAVEQGTPLENIYLEVFQDAMYEVGNLWHQGKITVDKEHYCTAVTQNAMAQFYPKIFSTPRKGLTLIACCVGNELHEMGIRMLCDLFELNGWDCIYLGAAVPVESIKKSIEENKPQLIALSVTMPHFLDQCKELIDALRNDGHYQDYKIAVGGRIFQLAPDLYKKWGVDVSTQSALELIEWANQNF